MQTLTHKTQGRNLRSATILGMASAGLIALFAFGTPWWVVAFLALFVIPTLVDVVFNPKAEFRMDESGIHWRNAAQEADLTFDQIVSATVFLRLNVAFRVTLTMENQGKVRIPQDVLPPRQDLEDALSRQNIPVTHERLRLL